jgi:pyrroline-5-carboxylate reductase
VADPTILLIGCGKMGNALLSGWLTRGIPASRIHIVEPAGVAQTDVAAVRAAGDLPAGLKPDVVVFAVKPQALDEIAPEYRRFTGAGAVALSIAAGKTIAVFERHLGANAAIVRTMPNTPAAVGRGITVACANQHANQAQRALCESLLEAVGEVAWVEDEALLDPVTAVSGSGPAYVFLLIETLAEAGVASGLPAELAQRLARATVIGSGELARLSHEDAAQLRKNVTSPGGTTAAALDVLMGAGGLVELMTRAVAAATRRSRELAG